jgi:nucleoid-associated protein YgaU
MHLTGGLLAVTAMWAAMVAALDSWGPTKRWARALTPRVLRGAVFTALTGTLVISPARAAGDLDGLPLPDRGVTDHPAGIASRPPNGHVVAAGESLWTIAAGRLAPGSPASSIARQSNAWYVQNRDVIGDDPDLILPGQVLASPLGEDSP